MAGGLGTRLAPLTDAVNKHLLPLAGEPMVFHALRHLRAAGIVKIMLISGADDLGQFCRSLSSGRGLEIELTYCAQDEPGGVAQALGLAEDFVGEDEFVMLLADNIFAGDLRSFMRRPFTRGNAARILLESVTTPQRFGIAELDASGTKLLSLEEKPARPRSHWAVIGAYRYGPSAFSLIPQLACSERGELDITALNDAYLQAGQLEFDKFEGAWADAGTHASYRHADEILRAHRQSRRSAA